jgi:acetyl esterase
MGISPSLEADRLAAVLLLSGGFDIEAVDLEGDFGWFLKTVAHYVTGAFPPAFVSSGNGDPLAPQAVALVQRLEELGVMVDSLFFPADYSPPLPHEYQFNLDTAAGQEALERMLAFIEASVQP